MGFFSNLTASAVSTMEVKTICSGADVLITRHTNLNLTGLNKSMRKHADKIIKPYVLNDITKDFNEASAALLKLAIFYKNFEAQGDQNSMEVIEQCISKIRDAVGSSIRGDISLLVISETGL